MIFFNILILYKDYCKIKLFIKIILSFHFDLDDLFDLVEN
jgi:hypothetical protein